MKATEVVQIVGAGPSGLAAAIVAAKSGRRVVIDERAAKVGSRFNDDFQGLENWTSAGNVLDEFREFGINTSFEAIAITEQVAFGPSGSVHRIRSNRPLYYLVRRGSKPGSLDTALLEQALSLGVEVRFGSSVRKPPPNALTARGPRYVSAMVAGLNFETDLRDGCFAALGNQFGAEGYGYLLVNRGRATLATCMFSNFRSVRSYLEKVMQFFQDRLSFALANVRTFGGFGNVFLAPRQPPDSSRHIGEAAGVQDALWGFGIRFAVRSGALEARSDPVMHPDHQLAWEQSIARHVRTSLVNRFLFDNSGDLAYRWLLWQLGRAEEPWRVLHHLYSPSPWKTALFPLVRVFARSQLNSASHSTFGLGESQRKTSTVSVGPHD